MDTLLFYVENGETPEMSLLTRSRRHSSLTLCSVRAMYCFVMPQSAYTVKAAYQHHIHLSGKNGLHHFLQNGGQSMVISEPCSAAAPTMVYPAFHIAAKLLGLPFQSYHRERRGNEIGFHRVVPLYTATCSGRWLSATPFLCFHDNVGLRDLLAIQHQGTDAVIVNIDAGW